MTSPTQGNQIAGTVIVLIVIYVVNVESTGRFIRLSTQSASLFIPSPYLLPEPIAKFWWVANIKPPLPFLGEFLALLTVNIARAALDKAFCLADITAATASTFNGYGIVMPIIFPSPDFVFSCPFSSALVGAEVVFYPLQPPSWLVKGLSAVLTGNHLAGLFLKPGVVVVNKFPFTAAIIEFIKRIPAAASAFNLYIFHAVIITKQG